MVGCNRGSSYIIHDATLLTLAPLAARASAAAAVGEADLGIVAGGTLVVDGGRIVAAGTRADCEAAARSLRARSSAVMEIDAGQAVVMPGLIDAHTHALFAGNRIDDLADIAAGRSPQLGMRYTIAQTRARSEDELIEIGGRHLALMRDHGTTTAEVKSGYELTTAGELRLLSVLASLDRRADLPHVVPTFCGAHALPPEFKDYGSFVDELCERTLPAVARQSVAAFADAFCEQGFFSAEQSERFLKSAAQQGLRSRIHADELHHSGGSRVAARISSVSADHLNFADAEDIAALSDAGCIAVLCPGTVFYLGLERYAPAQALSDAGVPLALATDFNPGTCPSASLQMIAFLARRHLGMTPSQTIAALTLNAAHALCLASVTGTLTSGKRGDAIVLGIKDYREFGYYFGCNLVARTFLG